MDHDNHGYKRTIIFLLLVILFILAIIFG